MDIRAPRTIWTYGLLSILRTLRRWWTRVKEVLHEHGFLVPAASELQEELPFEADIGTMLPAVREPGDPDETLVDALFFYID